LYPCSQQLSALGGHSFFNIPFLQYKLERFNTPIVALVINSLLCLGCTFIPFIVLVQMNNLLYGLLITLILSSMIKLRYSEKGRKLKRPFKMAESDTMVVIVLLWPLLLCLFMIATAVYSAILAISGKDE